MSKQNITEKPSLKSLFSQTNEYGHTRRKRPELQEVKSALEAGADVNESLADDTLVEYAIRRGQEELLALLLEHGADVSGEKGFRLLENLITHYRSPHFVNKNKRKKIIRILLTHGVSPNIRNKAGKTLLMLPHVDAEMAQFLIEHGADVNAQDDNGRTALSHICAYCFFNKELCKVLLDAGADTNLCDQYNRSPLMYTIIEQGDEEILDIIPFLIERGADPTIRDIYGFSLSHYAQHYSASAEVRRYLNQLLHKPADDGIIEQNSPKDGEFDEKKDDDGKNLLHILMSDRPWTSTFPHHKRVQYCTELVRRLCMSGIDVNERDGSGSTPLMYAAETSGTWCSEKFILILLEYGADPTIRDANGFTALNYAQFDNASPEVLKLLTPKE